MRHLYLMMGSMPFIGALQQPDSFISPTSLERFGGWAVVVAVLSWAGKHIARPTAGFEKAIDAFDKRTVQDSIFQAEVLRELGHTPPALPGEEGTE